MGLVRTNPWQQNRAMLADVGVFAGPRDGPASAVVRVFGSLHGWTPFRAGCICWGT